MGLMVLVFIWGLAEATFFFIIPDVILTFIAIHGFTIGFTSSLYALAGAMIGGVIMYVWSYKQRTTAMRFVESIPSIQGKMMKDVECSLKQNGLIAMILGPIRGIPYKVYAIYAPYTGIGMIKFLIASIPARFIRFFLTSMLAWFLSVVLFPDLIMWLKYAVWAVAWIIVYVIYFSIHPWKGKK